MAQPPSFPRPSVPPARSCPNPPRPLPPLGPPSPANTKPTPPTTPRSFPDASFVLTTHLVPAALPRSTPDFPLPHAPVRSSDRKQQKAEALRVADEIVGTRNKQWRGELNHLFASRKPLWACVNRYVKRDVQPSSGDEGITLFFTHANGFCKEIWEPCLLRLLEYHEMLPSTYKISEVWSWEAVNHGDSSLLNQQNLGGLYDWRDNARDILHFLLYYLPSSVSSSALPTHLPRLSEDAASRRRSDGFERRTLVTIGHSLGGYSIARAAIDMPKLFSSLILVDPVIRPHPPNAPSDARRTYYYIVGAAQRQDHWSSREEARSKFAAAPFFAAWDPAVLDIYLECALCDDPDGGVKLKMSKIQEAIMFSENLATDECWDLLDTLDPNVELRWIMPGKSSGQKSEEGVRELAVWRRPENSSNVIIPSSGHLVVQETPGLLASELNGFLQQKYGSAQPIRPRL